MTVFIDPPLWPAHGTHFSHLISDSSLGELHAFAATAQIAARAFDRDHYDVPAQRYAELIDLGAAPVSGKELARILAGSGLRISARERPEQVRKRLQLGWRRLGREFAQAPPQQWEAVGQLLLQRWSEPHRSYHAPHHLASVLRGVGIVDRAQELPRVSRGPVLVAAWYHDAVYRGEAGQDEEDSARLAQQQLDALLPDDTVAEVARLVRLTAAHQPDEDDLAGAALVDADLEVLARKTAAYRRYLQQVRVDFAEVDDAKFARGRAHVLRQLLGSRRLFHTRCGYLQWEGPARTNLEEELQKLERGDQPWRPAEEW